MSRDKIIYKCKLVKISAKAAMCYIMSSAGTYIKEFVHSDFGRTLPNLGTIMGNECDIIQLDVLQLYSEFSDAVLSEFEKLI